MKKPNSLFYSHLYDWYDVHCRSLPWRETTDGYRIWLSEVILQQTRVAQGLAYYRRFVERWPSVDDLAQAEESEVLREWQGLGYYSRARNLHRAAKMIVERGWQPFPTRFEDIRSLPGVGEYTAGAIISFAYDQPYPAMDGNVYRVLARLLDMDEAFDTTQGKKFFREQMALLFDHAHPRLFNSAIMEFGALWCTPILSDHCLFCPLQVHCLGYAHGTASLLPVRKARQSLRDRWMTYTIYLTQTGNKLYTLLHHRTAKDIWQHLYEFVLREHETKNDWEQHSSSQPFLSLTHVLSHQRLHVRFYIKIVECLPDYPGCIRVSWDELDEYALSRLTLKALEQLSLTDCI